MMSFTLQFAIFLSICWMSQGMVTRPIPDEDRRLNNEHSNQNDPGGGDFYFDEQKAADDVKVGKAIHQSTWSKEDKERHNLDESKGGSKIGDERDPKHYLSYLRKFKTDVLRYVQELEADVLRLKASHKVAEEPNKSQKNVNDGEMQNEVRENDTQKAVDSETNTKNESKKLQFKSNYITNYYRNNGIKIIDDEASEEDLENSSNSSSEEDLENSSNSSSEEDLENSSNSSSEEDLENSNNSSSEEDLENSSNSSSEEDLENSNNSSIDESDDSSHKSEISKGNKNSCNNSGCTEIKRKPDTYSFEAKTTTAIPIGETNIPKGGVKKLVYIPNDRNDGNLTESLLRYKQTNSKEADEKNLIMATGSQSSQTKKCTNKNFNNRKNKKNRPIKKPPSFTEHAVTKNHQSKNFDKVKFEKATESTDFDNFPKGASSLPDNRRNNQKNSNNIDGFDFDDKFSVPAQSATLSSQTSRDATSPENLESQKQCCVSKTSSQKSTNKKQQKEGTSPNQENQITSPKPEVEQTSFEPEGQITSKPEEKQQTNFSKTEEDHQIKSETEEEETNPQLPQNKEKGTSGKGNISHATVSSQFQHDKTVIKSSTSEMNTEVYTSDSAVNISPEDSKDKEPNVISTRTTLPYYKVHPNLNEGGSKDNSHAANDLGVVNISPTYSGNIDNSSKAVFGNLGDNSATGNNKLEKLSFNYTDKNDSEIQRDNIEQPKGTGKNLPTSSRSTITISDLNKVPSDNLIDGSETNENNKPANSNPNQLRKNYPENQGGNETEQPKNTDNSSTSVNTISINNSKKAPSDNLNNEPRTSENDKLAKSSTSKLDKLNSENQEDIKTGQSKAQQLNNDPEPKQLKNKELQYLNLENDNKEEDYLSSFAEIYGFQSKQDSNLEIQNLNNKASDKPQIYQKYTENSVKRDGRYEILSNSEYKYGNNNENFDNVNDLLERNQNREETFIFNNTEDHNNDDTVLDNTATVFTNLSPSSQYEENAIKKEPQEKYNTVLEYLYKHSNNPVILALRGSVQ